MKISHNEAKNWIQMVNTIAKTLRFTLINIGYFIIDIFIQPISAFINLLQKLGSFTIYLFLKLKKISFKKVNINLPTFTFKTPGITVPKVNLKLEVLNKKFNKPSFNINFIQKFHSFVSYLISSLFVFVKEVLYTPIRLIKFIFSKSILTFLLGIIFAGLFIFTPIMLYQWFRALPKPEMLIVEANSVKRPTRILDRNGKLLYEIYVDKKIEPVKISQIPQQVLDATIAAEDSEFYKHQGFRIERIVQAARANQTNQEVQGASTITQQLIKTVLLTPEKTLERKVKELVLSVIVEQKYSKDQILEMYLNNISYGGNAWGIQAAAQKYFGKDVKDLTLGETSLLVGITPAPTNYSPLINPDLAKVRQQYVLDRMLKTQKITQDQYNLAISEEIKLVQNTEYIKAPHFVNLVRKDLEEKYGARYVELGGLEIKTSLDLDLQEQVEKIVKEEVEKGKPLNFTNASSIVLDPKTGEILAYVGSVDYFKEGWGAYDVASAYRQPGSSIKPVTFALALEKGYTAASVIDDSPIVYKSSTEVYKPVNYDGKFHGRVSLRAALANSYNIPAVKLVKALGPDNMVSLGQEMGLLNWQTDGTYGLSVTLGGKEVRLMDLANVYATLARNGNYKDLKPVLSATDSYGYEVIKGENPETRVLSAATSYIISSILSDNAARTPAFGPNSALVIPNRQVAVKTGTTDNKKDNWTLGYTPSYVVGVWVGNNNNTQMNPNLASGLTGAAPIWHRVMKIVLESKNEAFEVPDSVIARQDKSCGNKTEYFAQDSKIPNSLCSKPKAPEKDKEDKKISLH